MVVGGGQVALRKVKALLEYAANVEVISPDLCSELSQLADYGEIHFQQRKYRPGDLQGAVIAIIATSDSNTNLEVVKEARREAVLVNVVDDAEYSDFITPSYMRRGDVTVAISTGGKSPALARKLRTILEKYLGDEYAALALLADEVRAEVKKQGIKVNGDDWQEALDIDLLGNLLRRGDNEKAKNVLLSNLKMRQK